MTAAKIKFVKFHEANPKVYEKLVQLALLVKSKGFATYSIESLFNQVRWHFNFEVFSQDKFKLNNNYKSFYARLIMQNVPALKNFFRTRDM